MPVITLYRSLEGHLGIEKLALDFLVLWGWFQKLSRVCAVVVSNILLGNPGDLFRVPEGN